MIKRTIDINFAGRVINRHLGVAAWTDSAEMILLHPVINQEAENLTERINIYQINQNFQYNAFYLLKFHCKFTNHLFARLLQTKKPTAMEKRALNLQLHGFQKINIGESSQNRHLAPRSSVYQQTPLLAAAANRNVVFFSLRLAHMGAVPAQSYNVQTAKPKNMSVATDIQLYLGFILGGHEQGNRYSALIPVEKPIKDACVFHELDQTMEKLYGFAATKIQPSLFQLFKSANFKNYINTALRLRQKDQLCLYFKDQNAQNTEVAILNRTQLASYTIYGNLNVKSFADSFCLSLKKKTENIVQIIQKLVIDREKVLISQAAKPASLADNYHIKESKQTIYPKNLSVLVSRKKLEGFPSAHAPTSSLTAYFISRLYLRESQSTTQNADQPIFGESVSTLDTLYTGEQEHKRKNNYNHIMDAISKHFLWSFAAVQNRVAHMGAIHQRGTAQMAPRQTAETPAEIRNRIAFAEAIHQSGTAQMAPRQTAETPSEIRNRVAFAEAIHQSGTAHMASRQMVIILAETRNRSDYNGVVNSSKADQIFPGHALAPTENAENRVRYIRQINQRRMEFTASEHRWKPVMITHNQTWKTMQISRNVQALANDLTQQQNKWKSFALRIMQIVTEKKHNFKQLAEVNFANMIMAVTSQMPPHWLIATLKEDLKKGIDTHQRPKGLNMGRNSLKLQPPHLQSLRGTTFQPTIAQDLVEKNVDLTARNALSGVPDSLRNDAGVRSRSLLATQILTHRATQPPNNASNIKKAEQVGEAGNDIALFKEEKTVKNNSATDTPANTAVNTSKNAVVPPPSPLGWDSAMTETEISKITEQVYRSIESRLRSEKIRRGML